MSNINIEDLLGNKFSTIKQNGLLKVALPLIIISTNLIDIFKLMTDEEKQIIIRKNIELGIHDDISLENAVSYVGLIAAYVAEQLVIIDNLNQGNSSVILENFSDTDPNILNEFDNEKIKFISEK